MVGLTNTEYVKAFAQMVSQLESHHKEIQFQIEDSELARLLHAGMGLCTESGEFLDQLKKGIVYGRPLDKTNLKEELGDILWYIQLAANVMGWSLFDLIAANMKKLEIRYGERFDKTKEMNRNLTAEKDALK